MFILNGSTSYVTASNIMSSATPPIKNPGDPAAVAKFHLAPDSIAARHHLTVDQVGRQPWLISDRVGLTHE